MIVQMTNTMPMGTIVLSEYPSRSCCFDNRRGFHEFHCSVDQIETSRQATDDSSGPQISLGTLLIVLLACWSPQPVMPAGP